MSRLHTPRPEGDPDLARQARPGHGVPSQDPDEAAQFAQSPEEAQREQASVLTGGGMVAGTAAGAAAGAVVGGPVGVVVGAVAGALIATAATAAAADLSFAGGASPLRVNGTRLHLEDSGGDGRPVVLIHGWPLSAQAWALQVPVLQAAGYRVLSYDRRGFGRSDKPQGDYGYDTLADDLQHVLEHCGLQEVSLVGFSMGGGEVARYIARHGESRLRSVVFAAAITPCLMRSSDNPEGPRTPEAAQASRQALEQDRDAFFDEFTRKFFSADGVLRVSETQRQETIALCQQSAPHAALACMDAFHHSDFREDLQRVTVPTLVIHGEADAIVPIAGSGERTHRAIAHSQMVRVAGAPHGLNVSHAPGFNGALVSFLAL